MADKADLPASMQKLVTAIGRPVTSEDLDIYGRLQAIQDESHRLRTVLAAWKNQQAQDRGLREKYATWLMIAMGAQIAVINVVYILMGCNVLTFEPWTARTFIMAVFAEVAALVFVVVKYLFTPSGDKILYLIRRKRSEK